MNYDIDPTIRYNHLRLQPFAKDSVVNEIDFFTFDRY